MRFLTLTLLVSLTIACQENKFRGGDHKASVVDVEEEPNIPGEGEASPFPGDECIKVKTLFTNTKIAKTTEVGQVRVDFTVECLEPSDSAVTGVFNLYSKDFLNPTYQNGVSVPNANPAKVNQLFQVFFDYKWVPEVTKYSGQEFILSADHKGAKWTKSIRYSITSYDPKKVDQDPKNPRQTFNGRDGHPGARP